MAAGDLKYNDARMKQSMRFKIVDATVKALDACRRTYGREAVLTAIYIDPNTHLKLQGEALRNHMAGPDVEALEKGEWMGAPLYVVRRANNSATGHHITATAEPMPDKRIG